MAVRALTSLVPVPTRMPTVSLVIELKEIVAVLEFRTWTPVELPLIVLVLIDAEAPELTLIPVGFVVNVLPVIVAEPD